MPTEPQIVQPSQRDTANLTDWQAQCDTYRQYSALLENADFQSLVGHREQIAALKVLESFRNHMSEIEVRARGAVWLAMSDLTQDLKRYCVLHEAAKAERDAKEKAQIENPLQKEPDPAGGL